MVTVIDRLQGRCTSHSPLSIIRQENKKNQNCLFSFFCEQTREFVSNLSRIRRGRSDTTTRTASVLPLKALVLLLSFSQPTRLDSRTRRCISKCAFISCIRMDGRIVLRRSTKRGGEAYHGHFGKRTDGDDAHGHVNADGRS